MRIEKRKLLKELPKLKALDPSIPDRVKAKGKDDINDRRIFEYDGRNFTICRNEEDCEVLFTYKVPAGAFKEYLDAEAGSYLDS